MKNQDTKNALSFALHAANDLLRNNRLDKAKKYADRVLELSNELGGFSVVDENGKSQSNGLTPCMIHYLYLKKRIDQKRFCIKAGNSSMNYSEFKTISKL